MDEHEVGPAGLEAVDCALAAVDGSVVDDQEHAARRRVGLGRHDLLDQRVERVVADLGLAAANQAALRVVDVDRGEIGQRPPASVLVLDQARPAAAGNDERVTPEQRLQLGLLVGTDDVVAGMQPPALPAALIQIEHAAGLLAELRVAREHPRAPRPRPDRILLKPAPNRGARNRAHDASRDRLARELSA